MALKQDALVPVEQPQITPMGMLEIAVSQGADIDKLTKLMELQERWEANNARKAFNAAMAKFKANPPQITKNRHVKFGQTEYDHATLDHVTDVITAGLSAVGISHKWAVLQSALEIAVTCILTHEQGHREETTLKATADTSGSKNSIQAIGSAVTYLQRYTLLAAVGMAARGADNDGSTGPSLPEHEVSEKLSWLEAANDLQELQRIFTAAYKMASDAKDKRAMAAFIAAKDARKKDLNAGR